MSNAVTLIWPGGEHTFALNIGELRALQNACDAGPEQILIRMVRQDWRIDDIVETIRLGLLGGGFKPGSDAGPLVLRAVAQQGLMALKMPAITILNAALLGEKDDEPGEPTGTETESAKSPLESGASAISTPTEPS